MFRRSVAVWCGRNSHYNPDNLFLLVNVVRKLKKRPQMQINLYNLILQNTNCATLLWSFVNIVLWKKTIDLTKLYLLVLNQQWQWQWTRRVQEALLYYIDRFKNYLLWNISIYLSIFCSFVKIQSVSTATLLRLVPTAVHVAVRLLRRNGLWHFVSTEAFFCVLNSSIFVAFLETSLLAERNGVFVRVMRFVGKNPFTTLIIHKADTVS